MGETLENCGVSWFLPATRRSVALVLSLTTGYVSPQFHLKFDDFFETVQETKSLPRSRWQFLSKLVTENGRPSVNTCARRGARVPIGQTRTSANLPESDDEFNLSTPKKQMTPTLLNLKIRSRSRSRSENKHIEMMTAW
jgi:hypothetical protein